MKIVGIDPGYAIVGWGVLEYHQNKFQTLAYGAVTTRAGLPFSKRLESIYLEFSEILKLYSPDAAAMEKLFFTNNKTTGIDVAQARGVLQLSVQLQSIPIFEYTPMQIKQAVVGYGKAVKTQVMEMTRVLLNLESLPKPDDAADALAVAIAHAHSSSSLLRYLK